MRTWLLTISLGLSLLSFVPEAKAQELALQHPTIVARAAHATAAEFLQEEISRRSPIRPVISSTMPGPGRASLILLDTVASPLPEAGAPPDRLRVPETPEGFALWIHGGRVILRGRDTRGLLFAAGRLIQSLEYGGRELRLPANLRIATAPHAPIRVHQLGYRNTANTYDLWDVATFDQYIRDLIIFGTNGIELIPALDPGARDSPVMKENMWDMTLALSGMIHGYGIDVWMWSPVMEDLSKPEEAREALEKRRRLFEHCTRIDHFFVPGGDDGDNAAEHLMPWLAALAKILEESHPQAKLWLSNQTFTSEENDYFFNFLASGEADWLAGVVHGPWTHLSLEELRARTPDRFNVRRYPDITRLVRSQYPVHDWDPAFAHTLNRAAVSPRPRDMTLIHNLYARHADGFGTYSDGVHDDLNKVVWSLIGWDPERTPEEMTRAYARTFFGAPQAELVTDALLGLEENWRGPILENQAIATTLTRWQKLWESLPREHARNWRLQMYLMRAYADAYVQETTRHQRAQEETANAALANAGSTGTAAAIAAARTALGTTAEAWYPPLAREYREEIERLAPMLLESIGYQLSVKPPYFARSVECGALLDTLDQPQNNRLWLETQFREIEELPEAAEQVRRLEALVAWETPDPGSFYDDLGNLTRQPHLVRQLRFEEDPGGLASAKAEFSLALNPMTLEFSAERLSWLSQAQTQFGTPLLMRYADLDPEASYRLRVTYAGRFGATMTLHANGEHLIHGPLKQPSPIAPIEFDVPRAATAGGTLTLSWALEQGRGCQVAEVWLLKKP